SYDLRAERTNGAAHALHRAIRKDQRHRQSWADQLGPKQFRAADRPGVAVCPEDRVTNGLWNFLWWPGEWPVFESQSRIQSSVLHQPILHFALRRADGQRFGWGLPRNSDSSPGWRLPGQLAGESQHSDLFLRR